MKDETRMCYWIGIWSLILGAYILTQSFMGIGFLLYGSFFLFLGMALHIKTKPKNT